MADMKGTLAFKSTTFKSRFTFKITTLIADMKGTLMADMKGTLDFKFTIFSLSCTLWVTDKPSNLDKPSRRFACDTLWVRPTNPPLYGAPARHHKPSSLHGAPARYRIRPNLPLTRYQPS